VPGDHEYGVSASRGVPVYVLAAFAGRLLIAPTHGGMARLSLPRPWLYVL